jgi:hypothetical protein
MKKKSSLDIQFDDPIQTSAQNNNEIGPFQKKKLVDGPFQFL